MCERVCTFVDMCDGRLNSTLNSASLSISTIDSLASTFCLCPLPVITCPVTASHSSVSDYIVRWLELGKHEMEVTLILIQVFNGVFYLRLSLPSHFRWAASHRPDCHEQRSLQLFTATETWPCDVILTFSSYIIKDIKLWQKSLEHILTCRSGYLNTAVQ